MLLVVSVGVLGVVGAAKAQQTASFTRPVVGFRAGAVQTVSEESSGLAPYVEGQSMIHLGKTFFGLALYGGLSYERSKMSNRFCVNFTCSDTRRRRTHLDLATGIRLGVFPRHGPVDVFIGFASHFVHQTEERFVQRTHAGEPVGDEKGSEGRWSRRFTVEGGVNAQVPVTSRFGIDVGVRGFLPVYVGERSPSVVDGLPDIDMSRFGFHVGMQYEF